MCVGHQFDETIVAWDLDSSGLVQYSTTHPSKLAYATAAQASRRATLARP